MRKIERIPIVLRCMEWRIFLKDMMGKDYDIDMLVEVKNNLESIKEFWLSNPDLRLTQVLVNLGICPNIPGHWYYTEEVDWLINRNVVQPRDILFWGTYGKNGDEPLRNVLIKDMSNDHIDNVLLNVPKISPIYKVAFEYEREYRRKNKIVIKNG